MRQIFWNKDVTSFAGIIYNEIDFGHQTRSMIDPDSVSRPLSPKIMLDANYSILFIASFREIILILF